MFFFFHLFAGIVLGVLASDLLHDRRWIVPLAIGAVLPDIIDKTVGYILFWDTIGSGRIYAHSLLFFLIVLVAGIIIWKFRSHPAGLALAAGILFHQLLDLMWRDPVPWYFPFAGPLETRSVEDYAFVLLKNDLSSRLEWILAALIIALIVVYILTRRKNDRIRQYGIIREKLLAAAALFFCILSGITLGLSIIPMKIASGFAEGYSGWSRPEEFVLGALVFALCACCAWRLRADPVTGANKTGLLLNQ